MIKCPKCGKEVDIMVCFPGEGDNEMCNDCAIKTLPKELKEKVETIYEEMERYEKEATKDVELYSKRINFKRELLIGVNIFEKLNDEEIDSIINMYEFKEQQIAKKIFDKFDEYSCIKNDKWYLKLKEMIKNGN